MADKHKHTQNTQSPPAQGVRLEWEKLPPHLKSRIEDWLGSSVETVISQPGGFSPGIAARMKAADGRSMFIKAIGPEPNADSPKLHRLEAKFTASLPPEINVPRLLWSYDDASDSGWVVLIFEEIQGYHPAEPWREDELTRIVESLSSLHERLTPAPIPHDPELRVSAKFQRSIHGWNLLQQNLDAYEERLDAWSLKYLGTLAALEQQAPAAVDGDTLLHFDLRADNILLSEDKVWFIDWPHACLGASWVDIITFAPSVRMQGGPSPEKLIQRYPAYAKADPDAVTAAIASIAGFFIYKGLQPPPPGLPTLRQFQHAQGVATQHWLAERLGWESPDTPA